MRTLLICSLLLLSQSLMAHKSSDSYLFLSVDQSHFSLRWDIALRDLHNIIEFDSNADQHIQWSELKNRQLDIFAYSLARLNVKSGSNTCVITPKTLKVNRRSDGHYAVLYANGHCPETIESLNIHYQLFFEVDTQHHGLLKITHADKDISFSFSQAIPDYSFLLNQSYSEKTFFHFINEGIWHIWVGYDHILFLLSLLLPAVLVHQQNRWVGISHFPETLKEVIKVVTAFTLAHSLTLSLVMMAALSLPVMLVEFAIAFSVLLAALNNLHPIISHKRWLLGFIFGLIHGFGFANVLSELELSQNSLLATLLGFNIGVELGQLVIVLAIMPIAYVLRNSWFYHTIILKLGSASIASMGLIWMVERTF